MTYTRLSRKTALSWAAGAIASATTEAAYRVSDLNFDVIRFDEISNNNYVGAYQSDHNRVGGRRGFINFMSEFRGSNVTDQPAPEMRLLRGCGFKETATGGAGSVYYTYSLDDIHLTTQSPAGYLAGITFGVNHDRLHEDVTDCIGNVVFNFTAGQIPTMTFNFEGLPSGTAYEAAPIAINTTQGTFPAPVQAESFHISGTTLGDITGQIVQSVTFDVGNMIDPRVDINGDFGYSEPILTGRNPIATVSIEANNTGTVDWEAAYITTQEELTVSWVHQDGGGKNVEAAFSFSGYLDSKPVLSDVNGKLCYTLVLKQSIDSGSTPFTIAFASS